MFKIRKSIVLASTVGSIIEIYDLFLFGLLSSFIATSFFPPGASNTLIKTLLIFSIGYIARPIGSLVFGVISDYYGRKKSLYISILLMGISTLMIALLPGYNSLGNLSIALLVALRIIQGFSAGGEYTNAITFLIEHSNQKDRGFLGSLATMGTNIGALLAIAATTAFLYLQSTYHFSPEYWRALFLISVPGTLLGLYIRKHVPESIEFIKCTLSTENNSFWNIAKSCVCNVISNPKRSLALLFFTIQGVSVTSILLVYTPIFLTKTVGFNQAHAQTLNLLSIITLILVIPLAGKLSDKWGRMTLTALSSIGLFAISLVYFSLLNHGTQTSILMALIITSALTAGFAVSASVLIVEVLPINIRATSAALIYGAGAAIFGSSMPLFSELIVKLTDNPVAPGYLMSGLSLLGMIGFKLLHSHLNPKNSEITRARALQP